TENTMEIAGLGKACEVAQRDLGVNQNRLLSMRDRLHKKIMDSLPNVYLNGHPDLRLPNTLNLSFENLEANLILSELTSVAASAGAACHSDDIILSPVLQAMKLPLSRAMGAIRFSIGKMTTEEEIDKAAEAVIETVSKLQPATGFHPQTESEQDYQLTRYTAGLGCACKLRPQALEKVLSGLTGHLDKRILVGNDTADDAAVFQLDADTALVQTVDFFTPIVDDPYRFGAIAAANSLSDIYAMGAQPLLALNIVGFPSNRLPLEILTRILQGARDKAAEAGISIVGGHTIDDPEPKFGLVVLGTVHPDKILRNSTAQDGDALILTKPLGTGIISTATKKGFASKESEDAAYRVMSSLNNKAAEIMQKYPVSACTDITGFGLLGHLREMIVNTNLQVKLYHNRIPQLPDLKKYIAEGAVPGGTLNNLEYVDADVIWDDRITKSDRLILADAQTSGGLLITLPAELEKQFLNDLKKNQVELAAVIGYLSKAEKPVIHVVQ
ncbi:MAG: selenide, water dikinase SelD, partial [Candidatus Cloacimonetes bacterium]|nr:selenide, water dikinase SelD [Candidatus Cloacimonadota bacterium]